MRICRKKTGPGVFMLMSRATTKNSGDNKIRLIKETRMSKVRFKSVAGGWFIKFFNDRAFVYHLEGFYLQPCMCNRGLTGSLQYAKVQA